MAKIMPIMVSTMSPVYIGVQRGQPLWRGPGGRAPVSPERVYGEAQPVAGGPGAESTLFLSGCARGTAPLPGARGQNPRFVLVCCCSRVCRATVLIVKRLEHNRVARWRDV